MLAELARVRQPPHPREWPTLLPERASKLAIVMTRHVQPVVQSEPETSLAVQLVLRLLGASQPAASADHEVSMYALVVAAKGEQIAPRCLLESSSSSSSQSGTTR